MIAKLIEICRRRELIWSLVGKDLKIRYHGSVLGYLWSLLNPFLMMIVFTLVFSIFMRIQMENYALFLISALLPWTFFSNSLLAGSLSIVGNGHFLQKFYCPRELFPITVILSNAVILLLSFIPFFLFMYYMTGGFGWSLLALPLVVGIHLLFTLGLAFALSSLYVYFRDVKHLLEFIMMVWFYVTPVIYPASMIPEKYRLLLTLNPVVPIIGLYRDVFYRLTFPSLENLAVAGGLALASLFAGWTIFRSLEKNFVKEL